MWDEQKRQRFQLLRQHDSAAALTDSERSELESLIQELQSAEAIYLGPATERLREERQRLDAQNHALETLARRREALAQHLRDVLAEAQAERRAIQGDLAALLVGGPGSQRDT
jgi:small-conductance mechanosensitive channel